MTQSTPPPREPAAPVTDIDAYLRQYRDRFTRDAMAARLIEAGHDPAAVDAAVARLEAERTEAVEGAVRAADADVAGARRVTRTIVLVVYALLALFVIVSLGIESADLLAAASNVVFVVLLVALGALIFWIIGRAGSTASMIAWSVVAVVVGMPLAFLGACLASVTVG